MNNDDEQSSSIHITYATTMHCIKTYGPDNVMLSNYKEFDAGGLDVSCEVKTMHIKYYNDM